MRQTLVVLALCACASPAFAAQDRYGPPQPQSAVGARAAPLPAGSLLGWIGKTAAPQATLAAPAPERPAPIAPWAQRLSAPQAQPVAVPQQQARTQPPPANAPQRYAARAAAAPPPIHTTEAPGASERPRFYSVARQYGAQPDPIPAPAAPRGPALTLNEIPTSDNLGRTQAPLDDGRANQAVAIPVTRQNAAANRISRNGL